jgi:8-oxo-dGTP pyrophosphatase MutT (NUDIX family)
VSKWTIFELENRLRKPLPGKEAQYKMAPQYRADLSDDAIDKLNPRLSAVLVLFYPIGNEWHLVFTQRRQYEGVHSGQISFPGGKQEAGETLEQTAIREAFEEVGVKSDMFRLVNPLSKLYIPPSNFLVFPQAAIAEEKPAFKKDDHEVESVVEIPISFFLNPENKSTAKINIHKDYQYEVPAFIYQGKVIWGATAIIISELVELLGLD